MERTTPFCLVAVSCFLLCSFSAGTLAQQAPANLDDIELSCLGLFSSYAIARDHADGDGMAQLFVENGELILIGGRNRFTNREEIKERISGYAPELTSHMLHITSTKFFPGDETTASGIAYALIMRGYKLRSEGPHPVKGLFSTAVEYRADFRLTDEGCKFAHVEVHATFSNSEFSVPE